MFMMKNLDLRYQSIKISYPAAAGYEGITSRNSYSIVSNGGMLVGYKKES
jgi:hypothetical protein